MGSYKIIFKPTIEKDLQNIAPTLVPRVMKRIEYLARMSHQRIETVL